MHGNMRLVGSNCYDVSSRHINLVVKQSELPPLELRRVQRFSLLTRSFSRTLAAAKEIRLLRLPIQHSQMLSFQRYRENRHPISKSIGPAFESRFAFDKEFQLPKEIPVTSALRTTPCGNCVLKRCHQRVREIRNGEDTCKSQRLATNFSKSSETFAKADPIIIDKINFINCKHNVELFPSAK